MSGLLQLPHKNSNTTDMEKEVIHSSQKCDPWRSGNSALMMSKDPVHTTQEITIPPFSTINMHTNISVKGHCMWVHVLMELMTGPQLPTAVMVTYRELHLGSGVPICLHNLGAHSIKIPAKTMVGQVRPVNQVPLVVLPIRTSGVSNNTQRGMDLGGSGPPSPQGVAQTRAGTGHRAVAQMGTPVCPQ